MQSAYGPALAMIPNVPGDALFMIWTDGGQNMWCSANSSPASQPWGQVGKRLGGQSRLGPSLATVANNNLAMVWKGKGSDPNIYFSQAVLSGVPTSDWMGSLMQAPNSAFGKQTLRDIVIPGCHDAGMYESWTSNAQTQDQDIFQQLSGGVRYLDLRVKHLIEPIHGSHFKINHGADEGPRLGVVLDGLYLFISRTNCNEVVIVKWSHFRDFDQDTYQEFMQTITKHKVSTYLYSAPPGQRLASIQLSTITSGGGKVIMVCDGEYPLTTKTPGVYIYRDGATQCKQEKRSGNPAQGDLRVYDCYSDTNDVNIMSQDQLAKFAKYDGNCDPSNPNEAQIPCDLYLVSWTLTPSLLWGVQPLAMAANAILPAQWSKNVNQMMPNVLLLDYYNYSIVTNACIAANSQLQ